MTVTTVLLALAVALLVLALPFGAAGVVAASAPLLGAGVGLSLGAVAVLLTAGLLAGGRAVARSRRERWAEREGWQPPDEQIP